MAPRKTVMEPEEDADEVASNSSCGMGASDNNDEFEDNVYEEKEDIKTSFTVKPAKRTTARNKSMKGIITKSDEDDSKSTRKKPSSASKKKPQLVSAVANTKSLSNHDLSPSNLKSKSTLLSSPPRRIGLSRQARARPLH